MRFSTIIASMVLTAIAVIASPVQSLQRPGRGQCLHQSDAEKIVTEYIAILSHTSSDLGDANATAQALLDDNYQEISDSVLSLKGLPVSSRFPNVLLNSLIYPSSVR
jgi:hypothetical protein